jgi:hypothetical protein
LEIILKRRSYNPDFMVTGSISTYGVLGDPSEPLLKLCIGKINGTNRMMRPNTATDFEFLKILNPTMQKISK